MIFLSTDETNGQTSDAEKELQERVERARILAQQVQIQKQKEAEEVIIFQALLISCTCYMQQKFKIFQTKN